MFELLQVRLVDTGGLEVLKVSLADLLNMLLRLNSSRCTDEKDEKGQVRMVESQVDQDHLCEGMLPVTTRV